MIVANTNLIAYLFIRGERTEQARKIYQRDPKWVAPVLWRSELRNVLARYMHGRALALPVALEVMELAESLLTGSEYQVASGAVLELAARSGCSACDCEFAALAQDLGIPLVTSDKRMLSAFGSLAVSPDDL